VLGFFDQSLIEGRIAGRISNNFPTVNNLCSALLCLAASTSRFYWSQLDELEGGRAGGHNTTAKANYRAPLVVFCKQHWSPMGWHWNRLHCCCQIEKPPPLAGRSLWGCACGNGSMSLQAGELAKWGKTKGATETRRRQKEKHTHTNGRPNCASLHVCVCVCVHWALLFASELGACASACGWPWGRSVRVELCARLCAAFAPPPEQRLSSAAAPLCAHRVNSLAHWHLRQCRRSSVLAGGQREPEMESQARGAEGAIYLAGWLAGWPAGWTVALE